MIRYSSFLFKNIINKKMIYILALIGLIIYTVTNVILVKLANDDNKSLFDTANVFSTYFIFVFAVIYVVSVVVFIFKDQESNGVDLMVISKKFSRRQIVVGKFFVTFLFVAIFTLAFAAVSWIPVILDENLTSEGKIKFIFSIIIGLLLIQAFFASLSILLSLFMSKNGLMTLVVIVATSIPMISYIVQDFTNGKPKDVKQLENPLFVHDISKDVENQDFNYNEDAEILYDIENSNIQYDYEIYNDEKSYQNIAPIDPWYHFNSMMNMFVDKNRYLTDVAQDWEQSETHINSGDEDLFLGVVKGRELFASVTVPRDYFENDPFSSNSFDYHRNVVVASTNAYNWLIDNLMYDVFQTSSIVKRLRFVQMFIRGSERNTPADIKTITDIFDNDEYDEYFSLAGIEPISAIAYKNMLNINWITR